MKRLEKVVLFETHSHTSFLKANPMAKVEMDKFSLFIYTTGMEVNSSLQVFANFSLWYPHLLQESISTDQWSLWKNLLLNFLPTSFICCQCWYWSLESHGATNIWVYRHIIVFHICTIQLSFIYVKVTQICKIGGLTSVQGQGQTSCSQCTHEGWLGVGPRLQPVLLQTQPYFWILHKITRTMCVMVHQQNMKMKQ